jgi:hypothetical protein
MVDAGTKRRVFAMLAARGAFKAVLRYNGGNDEGGVDEITLHVMNDAGEVTEVDFPCQWDAKDEDRELSELLEGPVDAKYGSWAGDFSAYGTLTWDRDAGTVVLDDYEQSEYANTREEW